MRASALQAAPATYAERDRGAKMKIVRTKRSASNTLRKTAFPRCKRRLRACASPSVKPSYLWACVPLFGFLDVWAFGRFQLRSLTVAVLIWITERIPPGLRRLGRFDPTRRVPPLLCIARAQQQDSPWPYECHRVTPRTAIAAWPARTSTPPREGPRTIRQWRPSSARSPVYPAQAPRGTAR